jgi:hypothetical protein
MYSTLGTNPSNPSLKLTRYGRRCKPGLRHMVHHRVPGFKHHGREVAR